MTVLCLAGGNISLNKASNASVFIVLVGFQLMFDL